MSVLAIPEPQAFPVERAEALSRQIEVWAADCDDLDALVDTRARLAAIESYLERRNEEAAAALRRADRRVEVRIGQLLGPGEVGRNQHSEGSFANEPSLSKDERYVLRAIAAHADHPAVADAINDGATRAEVLRRVNAIKQPAPTPPPPPEQTLHDKVAAIFDALDRFNQACAALGDTDAIKQALADFPAPQIAGAVWARTTEKAVTNLLALRDLADDQPNLRSVQ